MLGLAQGDARDEEAGSAGPLKEFSSALAAELSQQSSIRVGSRLLPLLLAAREPESELSQLGTSSSGHGRATRGCAGGGESARALTRPRTSGTESHVSPGDARASGEASLGPESSKLSELLQGLPGGSRSAMPTSGAAHTSPQLADRGSGAVAPISQEDMAALPEEVAAA